MYFFFFFQAEDGIRDDLVTGVQTCALPISPDFILPISCCGSAPLFILPISRCGSAPAFYTANFSLRQRPTFYTARFLLRQRPWFLYCPFLVAAAPHFLYCPGSCCGSAPAFFTDHFSLRQRPRFLYCPFLVAADRKSTRLNSSHQIISYAVFCLKKKKNKTKHISRHENKHI